MTPVAMGKTTRGVELKSVDDLDERQIAAWMKQVGGRARCRREEAVGQETAAKAKDGAEAAPGGPGLRVSHAADFTPVPHSRPG